MTTKRKCSVLGCDKPGCAAGMCYGHYKRLKSFGSTDVKCGSKAPLIERFWLYVNRRGDDDCWMWTGSTRGKGYGRIKDNGKTFPSHRVSYEIHFGPIPDGLLVCHRCDVPGCVNPRHLFLGDQKANLADRNQKGRFHPVAGERHGASKLTEAQVTAILGDTRSQTAIANDYGIDRANVSYIKARKTWRHI